MLKVAQALLQIGAEIPDDINWVLRVDGHTDNIPLVWNGGRIRDNWELSSEPGNVGGAVFSSRQRHSSAGDSSPQVSVSFNRLKMPIPTRHSAKNRRIELKLTER